MVNKDNKPLLKQRVAERLEVELTAVMQLHKNMGKMYDKHGFEDARFMENVLAGWYRKFIMESKGLI